jgi:hypothetical protein
MKSKLTCFFQLHHIQDDEDDRKPKDLVHHQSNQNYNCREQNCEKVMSSKCAQALQTSQKQKKTEEKL